MATRSKETRFIVAGSAVNVDLNIRVSYNEMQAMLWAVNKMRMLFNRGIVTLPKNQPSDLVDRAALRIVERIVIAEPDARKRVIEAAKLEEAP